MFKAGLDKITGMLNSYKYKNSKFLYNVKSLARYYTPKFFLRGRLRAMLGALKDYDKKEICDRVNYYCRLEEKTALPETAVKLADFKYKKRKGQSSLTAYFFDTYEYVRYFAGGLKICHDFGDVTQTPPWPAIVKSRPIGALNANAVLLNLDKLRHFTFIEDKKDFKDKKDMLVGRGAVYQPHRVKFWEMYFNHPLCDLGHCGIDARRKEWVKKFMSIGRHLDYKFILCLEGNDVATNLKWVMSSNSVAVMPRPKYETWFMEGRLIPGRHYIEISPDFTDLEEKLNYYIARPDEAQKISQNAQAYVAQFRDKKKEDLISLLVLQKYFKMTGQQP
ncbi:MAG: lipopolysaccharide biosynthesis protein [Elusimicrobiota bacterium]|jgi:hypothetical protein|nr:lipopolysaccharide biosynthesis protein [Elusimicrobiota bacterium]